MKPRSSIRGTQQENDILLFTSTEQYPWHALGKHGAVSVARIRKTFGKLCSSTEQYPWHAYNDIHLYIHLYGAVSVARIGNCNFEATEQYQWHALGKHLGNSAISRSSIRGTH